MQKREFSVGPYEVRGKIDYDKLIKEFGVNKISDEDLSRIKKKINVSTIKAAFGFTDSNNIGSIFYTAMQTVPVFLPNILRKENRPCLIPLAIDQDVHFRISRDVVEKLGHKKPAIIHSVFMPPLTGTEGKMASTSDIAIYATDDPKTVEDKIKKYAFSGGQATLD